MYSMGFYQGIEVLYFSKLNVYGYFDQFDSLVTSSRMSVIFDSIDIDTNNGVVKWF